MSYEGRLCMISFKEIERIAEEQHGEFKPLLKKISQPLSCEELSLLPDEFFLSALSKVIFQVGFNWGIIDKKWPDFEQAFFQFKLLPCSLVADEQLERIMATGKVVKNWPKIRAIRTNAYWLQEISNEHGNVGAFMASLRADHFCENIAALKKQGDRVGAKTAQLWLRRVGADSLIFSHDVISVLKRHQIVDKVPSSKRDQLKLQEQLNRWMDETGQGLTYISQMLAFSTGPR